MRNLLVRLKKVATLQDLDVVKREASAILARLHKSI